MSRNSESNQTSSVYPWLDQVRQDKTKRTIDLGKKAIYKLVEEGKNVTYASIARKSKELDPDEKGIHQNTIRSNDDLFEYYTQHSVSYKKNQARKSRRKAKKEVAVTQSFEDVKVSRDIENVRKRYRKMTKEELIEKLIQAEQYIAENHEKWVIEQFRAFSNK